ncbi:MAG: 2,3-bisphosphoglycerate-independent phosphoglycerate mutase [Halanaerobiaceae bacterium]
MKTILIIADGLAGRPTDYKNQTCLQAANTPNLDKMAESGILGLMDSIKPGVRPGSDTAHLSIFGYDPYKCYTGRGIYEAAGIGMEVQNGDVCFRTNFVTLDREGKIKDRRAGRISEGQDQLEEALQNLKSEKYPEVEIKFLKSTEHRGALLFRGEGLGDNVSDTDPHELGVPVPESKALDNKSKKTAEILNEVMEQAYSILKDHPLNKKREKEGKLPANTILARGSARYPDIKSVQEKYGIEASVVAAGALYKGVASVCGMEVKDAEGADGTVDSNILNKAKLAVEELDQGKDLVFVHFKGTDNASHDHDAEAKIKFIEKIDQTFGWLQKNIDWEDTHLAFASDHTTPPRTGEHAADPVPVLIKGPNVRIDKVKTFDEYACAEGGLGRFSSQLLPILLSYSDLTDKFGA